LALISVSLDVLDTVQQFRSWPVDTPLSQLRTACGYRTSELENAGFIVSYQIDEPDTVLYELAVRTGDVFTLLPTAPRLPEAGPGELVVGMNVQRPTGDVLEVSDNATVADIQRELGRFAGTRGRPVLYIGRYVVDLDATLADYRLANGDMVSLAMLPSHQDAVLLLVPARGGYSPFHVEGQRAILGGARPGEPVTVDIGNILPRRKRSVVQGPQAELMRINEMWHIQLLPSASLPMFLDSQRLMPMRPKALHENNVISLGTSPTEPLLQLVVQFEIA
jgi:hypothetical protein